MGNISNLLTSNREDWETPRKLFEELDREFHFTLDPCSTHKNAKCKKHYTAEEDGLRMSWEGEVVFCNPPCGRKIGNWVKKCYNEWKNNGTKIVMLIPARTDTTYFHNCKFRKTEQELKKSREDAEEMLRNKGLKRVTKKDLDGREYISTEAI